MNRRTLFALLLCIVLSAPVIAETTARATTTRDVTTAPEPTNFGVLLDSGGDTGSEPEQEETPPAEELEGLLLREDAIEGVFLVIKTDEEFRIVELARRTSAPYVIGTNGGIWKIGQLTHEDTAYGPVLKVKPQGLTELQELDVLFDTTWKGGVRVAVGDVNGDGQAGVEPDEIDVALTDDEAGMKEAKLQPRKQGGDGPQGDQGIEPDDIDSELTDEELAMLLPAVQKIRAAEDSASDEELAALLLPAVQKVQAEPKSEDGFFDKLFSLFR